MSAWGCKEIIAVVNYEKYIMVGTFEQQKECLQTDIFPIALVLKTVLISTENASEKTKYSETSIKRTLN